MRKGSVV